jgi:hypothetical protein
LITSFLALSTSAIGAQQAQRPGSADLLGLKWTVDEIKAAVAPARAGRDLTPKQWPNGAKVAVCLSFDVDNESPLLAAGRTAVSPLSETEFGAKQGVPLTGLTAVHFFPEMKGGTSASLYQMCTMGMR